MIALGAGPVKDTELETESKKTDEVEKKLDEYLAVEINDREKNEMESEVKHSEEEPEMVLDDPLKSSEENLVTAKSDDDSETEGKNNHQ